MKKRYFLFVFMSIFAISCASNEKKAQQIIVEHLETTLDDFSRYEGVNWGPLDSLKVEDDAKYIMQIEGIERVTMRLDEMRLLKASVDSTYTVYRHIVDSEADMIKSIERYASLAEVYAAEFNTEFRGWKIKHKYRAPNKEGALEITEAIFIIDPEFKEVKSCTVI